MTEKRAENRRAQETARKYATETLASMNISPEDLPLAHKHLVLAFRAIVKHRDALEAVNALRKALRLDPLRVPIIPE